MERDIRELLDRAEGGKKGGSRRRPEPPPPQRENRYVYGGDAAPQAPPDGAPARNRKVTRRRLSTFTMILLLFGAGIAIVVYINNIITINHLAADIGVLQERYAAIQNVNAALQADVNRKSAWERIGSTATTQLGLEFPHEQPQAVTPDPETASRLKVE